MGVESIATTLRLMAVAAALMMSGVTAIGARSPQPEGRPSTSAAGIPAKLQPQILILAAEDFTRPWVQPTVEGFRHAVMKGANPPVLSFETLDQPRFDGPEYAEKLRAWWSYKYRNRRFDLIVALGEDTVGFLAEHDGDPWRQTPVLFVEVGGVRVDTARHLPYAEGLIFEDHFQAALGVVKSILPATTHVALILGASRSESDRWDSIGESVRTAGLGLTPVVLAGLSMEDRRGNRRGNRGPREVFPPSFIEFRARHDRCETCWSSSCLVPTSISSATCERACWAAPFAARDNSSRRRGGQSQYRGVSDHEICPRWRSRPRPQQRSLTPRCSCLSRSRRFTLHPAPPAKARKIWLVFPSAVGLNCAVHVLALKALRVAPPALRAANGLDRAIREPVVRNYRRPYGSGLARASHKLPDDVLRWRARRMLFDGCVSEPVRLDRSGAL